MKQYELLQIENGNEKALARGTEKELVEFWNYNKHDLTDWIFENLDTNIDEQQREADEMTDLIATTVENIDELLWVLNGVDYDWWKLEVIELD